MELDELKQSWQADRPAKPVNENIIGLIQHKSSGPLAALKRSFRKQMILIPILAAIVINNLTMHHHQIFNDVMFWSYIVFCAGLCIFFYFNYRLVSRMDKMDMMIRSNLDQQIRVLETRLKWHIIGVRIALIFFIVLSEILPYFQYEPMLNKWHTVPPVFRILVYAAFLLFQRFSSRRRSQRKYGQHLAYLKELAKQMQ